MADETNHTEAFLGVLNSGGILVNPSASLLESVVGMDTDGELRVLAEESNVKQATNNFVTATRLADRLDDGLDVRQEAELSDSMYFATENSVTALIETRAGVEVLSTDDTETAQNVFDSAVEAFEAAEEIRLRVPAYSTLIDSMRETLSDEMADDFEEAYQNLENLDRDSTMDEVALVLLLAAKNEELLYEVSRWGEDTRLASKATFSRMKTTLEDEGLIETEKVPIDVGRPRLRLTLPSEVSVQSAADVVELVTE